MKNIHNMVDKYVKLENDIIDELDKMDMDECRCDEPDTIDFIHDGQWKEIVTRCINCGGAIIDAHR